MNISVVVITRNRSQFLERCVQSLIRQDYQNCEILVVDSSGNYLTKKLIEEKFKNVRYLYLNNGKNRMPASRNLGIRYALGDVVAFLDDDVVVLRGWLKACRDGYIDKKVGGVGGRIIDIDGDNVVAHTKMMHGKVLIGEMTSDILGMGNFHIDTRKLIEVAYLRGCNMSFRKELLCKIGGFDGNYSGDNFMEEIDVCFRIRKLGCKLHYNADMAIEHRFAPRESIPRKGQYLKRKFYTNKNKVYFAMNNMKYKNTLNYIVFKDTGFFAVIRTISLRNVLCFLFCFGGKFFGILSFWLTRLLRKRRGIYLYGTENFGNHSYIT